MRSTARGVACAVMAVGIATAVAGPAPAGPTSTAAGAPGPLYSAPFTDSLFEVVDGELTATSYERWRDTYGFATPVAAASSYEKYSWSPTIYATSGFPGTAETLTGALSPQQWGAVGNPRPATSPLIDGSEIFAWASSDELFIDAPDRSVHKLSRSEWDATGNAAFTDRGPSGFVTLTWNPNIVFALDAVRGANLQIPGNKLTYVEWAALDFPTPRGFQTFPNDRFKLHCDGSIQYYGPTYYFTLTYAEWVAAGSPPPEPPRVTC